MLTSKEKLVVEDYIIQKLKERGWQYKIPEELNRESYEEPLLIHNLTEAVKKINEYVEFTETDISKILAELRSKTSGVEGTKQILRFLKNGIPVKLDKTKEVKYIDLIDYKNPENNEFIVSRQVIYDGKERIRTDIILYVNGIPLVDIECKDPTNPSVSWEDAFNQVKNYERLVPELYKYVQFSIAAEEQAKYFPNVPWEDYTLTHTWRYQDFDELDSTVEMLSKYTLLDLIKNFIFIREERSKVTKVIARYMQYYAANKIFDRVINNLQGKEDRNSGLIWHWQGSGKTLTMIFAMNKLRLDPILANPTMFFILDRTELEEQIFQEINFLDLGIKPDKVSSINELKKILLHDEGRGKRGIIITLIHKFEKEQLDDLNKYLLEKLEKGKETILTRKNVIAFIDEGHRTQYGVLAAQMRVILKNAFFFAFTGTPLAKKGRDTFQVFSYPRQKEDYLDKYFIQDSIIDGFTVPLVWNSRLDQLHLKRKLLDSFLAQELEEIPEDLRKVVQKSVKRKLNSIRLVLQDPKRIDQIANDLANHFKENIDGRFKAMVVAVSRRACVLYKRALDKYLPSNYSEVVMTYTNTDPRVISDYLTELKTKWKKTDTEDIKKDIIEKFKEEEYPKILIVTDMLLTGFDAPILQVMYLDKLLKEHRLLQAIARTNRPFKEKEAGLIIDYVGVFKDLNKALAIYSKEDIEHAIYNPKEYEKKFKELIIELKELFKGVEIKYDRDHLKTVISKLITEGKEKQFVEKYKKLRKVFEFLGPSKVKLDFLDYYKWLTAVYQMYIRSKAQPEKDEYVKRFFKHTVKSIYKSTQMEKIDKEFPAVTINEKYIDEIEKRSSKLESRVFDSLTAIRLVIRDKPRTPVYESITDRVDRIIKRWRERKEKVENVYKEIKDVIKDLFEIDKRKKKLGLSDAEYSILSILEEKFGKKGELIKKVKDLYSDIKPEMFKGWNLKKSSVKKIGRIVRKFLIKLGLSKTERDELYEKIIKSLKEFY